MIKVEMHDICRSWVTLRGVVDPRYIAYAHVYA